MDIKKYIEKLNKKVSKRKEDIKDFRESHNPELINVIPVYERENAEYETIIAMLEKQIPKDIKYEYQTVYFCPPDCGGKENDEYGYVPYFPSCNVELNDMPEDNFCCRCGQKLAWS